MANTYTQIYIHLIIVVKNRDCILQEEMQDDVFKYIIGIVQQRGHKVLAINGMPDHVHILIGLNPDESLSTLVKEIKRASTLFINNKNFILVDDVYTTGATLNEAAKVLKINGAKNIIGITLAGQIY